MDIVGSGGARLLVAPAAQAVTPSRSWRYLIHEEPTAALQMACDIGLAREGLATVRLFRWQRPALSFGYRQRWPEWIRAGELEAAGVEAVERPTGGGMAVHGSDLSCSVVVPRRGGERLRPILERLCEAIAQACRSFHVDAQWDTDASPTSPIAYCLTQVSPYAVTVEGRKLCGFAVRAYAASWLIQGSLLVHRIPEAIRRLMPEPVRREYETRAICLEDAAGGCLEDSEVIKEIGDAMRYL
jgi:lipoate-protein ligase A